MTWGFALSEVLGPCPTPCRGLTARSISGLVPESPRRYREAKGMVTNAHGLLLFNGSADEHLLGLPLRRGELVHLDMASGSWRVLDIELHVNGFRAHVVGDESGDWRSVTWSPFAMVMEDEECFYLNGRCPVFRVSLTKKLWYVFATTGPDADILREEWTADISRALRLLAKSIFPTFALAVDPNEDVEATSTRLLAGYLLRSERDNIASVLYCELHVQQEESATFAMYEDERCLRRVGAIEVTQRTNIIDRRAVDCSCFSVDRYSFSARSLQEKQMWLSALSNIKVKLMNCAPAPSDEELEGFREAIFERITSLGRCELPSPDEELPMLRPCRGVPITTWCGSAAKETAGDRRGEGPLFDKSSNHQASAPQSLATEWSIPRDLPPAMVEAAIRKLARGVPVAVSNCPNSRAPVEAPDKAAIAPEEPCEAGGGGAAAEFAAETGLGGEAVQAAGAAAATGEKVVYRNAASALLGGKLPQAQQAAPARGNFAMMLAAPRPPRTMSAVFEEDVGLFSAGGAEAGVGRLAEVQRPCPRAAAPLMPAKDDSEQLPRDGIKGTGLFWSLENSI